LVQINKLNLVLGSSLLLSKFNFVLCQSSK